MSKYIVKEDCEIEIVTSYDEGADFPETETQVFKKGETIEFDIVEYALDSEFKENKKIAQIQFGNGSISLAVTLDWFQEVKEDVFMKLEEAAGILLKVARNSLTHDYKDEDVILAADTVEDHFVNNVFNGEE